MDPPTLNISPTTLKMTPAAGQEGLKLLVSNPSDEHSVLYKAKTTSPSRYIVRNRQGVVAPGCTQTILISLQRGFVITEDDKPDVFLIEARFLHPGEPERINATTDYGALMKAHGKQGISKSQVSCLLLVAEEADLRSPSDMTSNHTQPERVVSRTGAGPAAAAAAASPQQTATPSRNLQLETPQSQQRAAAPPSEWTGSSSSSVTRRDTSSSAAPGGQQPQQAQATTAVRPAPASMAKGSKPTSWVVYAAGLSVVLGALYVALPSSSSPEGAASAAADDAAPSAGATA